MPGLFHLYLLLIYRQQILFYVTTEPFLSKLSTGISLSFTLLFNSMASLHQQL